MDVGCTAVSNRADRFVHQLYLTGYADVRREAAPQRAQLDTSSDSRAKAKPFDPVIIPTTNRASACVGCWSLEDHQQLTHRRSTLCVQC